jgi:hypothetical protein
MMETKMREIVLPVPDDVYELLERELAEDADIVDVQINDGDENINCIILTLTDGNRILIGPEQHFNKDESN